MFTVQTWRSGLNIMKDKITTRKPRMAISWVKKQIQEVTYSLLAKNRQAELQVSERLCLIRGKR